MDWCLIVASNSEEVLNSSLLASPGLKGRVELSVQRRADSAALAYNRGIDDTKAELMMFVHQDMYLPPGWLQELEAGLSRLQRQDPAWGVAGLIGIDSRGMQQGLIYSCGLRGVVGAGFQGARQVETLDEVLLVVRRSSGLQFDEGLRSFHLYGADICLQARERGLKSYAITALGIHNSNGIGLLPWAYWKCWLYLRRKWSTQLPIRTPCMPITRWGGPAIRYLVGHTLWLLRRGQGGGQRVANPYAIWQLLKEGHEIKGATSCAQCAPRTFRAG